MAFRFVIFAQSSAHDGDIVVVVVVLVTPNGRQSSKTISVPMECSWLSCTTEADVMDGVCDDDE
jgi:hypothetical protein